MTAPKLTKAQREALEHWYRTHEIHHLARREFFDLGLMRWIRDGSFMYVDLTDAGRAALKDGAK